MSITPSKAAHQAADKISKMNRGLDHEMFINVVFIVLLQLALFDFLLGP